MNNKDNFQDIVSRAMTDESFLNLLLKDPLKATSDYNLSAEEISALSAVNCEELMQIGDDLGERLSKGYLDLSMFNIIYGHTSTYTNSHSSTHSNRVAPDPIFTDVK